MLERLKCKLRAAVPYVKQIPAVYILIPALLVAAAICIRIICGSGCAMCRFTGGIGLFPGTFFYTVGYVLRLVLCGVLLSSALFSYRIERRVIPSVIAALLCCMMLFEYKLIFIMCRFFAASLLSLACAAAAFLSLIYQRGCTKSVSICALLYIVMQAVFFIQVVSLLFCV